MSYIVANNIWVMQKSLNRRVHSTKNMGSSHYGFTLNCEDPYIAKDKFNWYEGVLCTCCIKLDSAIQLCSVL